MALGPFILVDNAIEQIANGTIDLTTDTFRAVLVTAAHTADPSDETWADISANEASGSGYTGDGIDVSPLVVSRTGGTIKVDSATNPSWDPATVSAKYIYLMREGGTGLASGDLILGYRDLNTGGGNLSAVGDEFTVEWPVDGIFTLSRAA